MRPPCGRGATYKVSSASFVKRSPVTSHFTLLPHGSLMGFRAGYARAICGYLCDYLPVCGPGNEHRGRTTVFDRGSEEMVRGVQGSDNNGAAHTWALVRGKLVFICQLVPLLCNAANDSCPLREHKRLNLP
ncbi:hypothetical protein NDU88_007541 [Pleurodeles waltl]|uniref:Uncharacterized protein n=1 Tax=Pleurodeles waltl TaxID=8319 RepID=A0AAV7VUR7_PLEWA|nr:hypothetical protein NDU88_007541 [Pleurodeles waltl]